MKERIRAWVQAHTEEYIADLSALCAVNSVTGPETKGMPFGPGPAEALDRALALAEHYGLSTKNYGHFIGAADLNPALPKGLDILGHLDIVDAGDGWHTDPFRVELRDGILYGRGVADDKGGLLAALYALCCVKELELPLSKNCRVLLGCDEETEMRDTLHYYLKEKPAPFTCTPDISFPVCNTEKAFYRPSFSAELPEENALPRVVSFHGGYRTNVVPGEAKAVLAGLDTETLGMALHPLCVEIGVKFDLSPVENGTEIHIIGHGCHAAEPENGNNPITALLRLLSELPLADCPSTRVLQGLNQLFPHGDWSGRAAGIAQSDEVSGPLTCSFTRLTLEEGKLWGICDCRVPLCMDKKSGPDILESKLRALGLTPKSEYMTGHHTPADSEGVKTLLRCYAEYSGEESYCFSTGGGTYVHHIPGGVGFGPLAPGYDSAMHGPDEHIPLEQLLLCIRVYAAVIAEFCGE